MSEAKFKVGDIVTGKKGLIPYNSYGGMQLLDTMFDLINNKEQVIKRVTSKESGVTYTLDRALPYQFSEEMLEPVVDVTEAIPTENTIKFQDKLCELAKQKGISQAELGRQTQISDSAMSRYFNGERIPTIDIAIKLAKYFNITIDELLGLPSTKTSKVKIVATKHVDYQLQECSDELYFKTTDDVKIGDLVYCNTSYGLVICRIKKVYTALDELFKLKKLPPLDHIKKCRSTLEEGAKTSD